MITFVKGNLFESPAKVLVNTVNTVGVMGKGIAKTFKDIYPEMFSRYLRLCEDHQFNVGNLWLYKTSHKWILNFPTKKDWRQPSRTEYVEAGLKKFVEGYARHGITGAAFPRLGCGNGELDWEQVVRPLMMKYLAELPIQIFIYEYFKRPEVPEHRDIQTTAAWLHAEPRALPFSEMWNDLSTQIGTGRTLKTAGGVDFKVRSLGSNGSSGLRLEVDKSVWGRLFSRISALVRSKPARPILPTEGQVFIPQEAMLDLWQNIRSFGFCTAAVMPGGMEELAPYLLSILEQLDYMRPVQLATPQQQDAGTSEAALEFFPAPQVSSGGPSPSLSVQPA